MWIFQFPGLFCEYFLWWVIKCSILATIVLNCCNGILYFNLKWDCIPVLTACFIIYSWFWNAAMTSVNYIDQDMRKKKKIVSLFFNLKRWHFLCFGTGQAHHCSSSCAVTLQTQVSPLRDTVLCGREEGAGSDPRLLAQTGISLSQRQNS